MRFSSLPAKLEQPEWQQISMDSGVAVLPIRIFAGHEVAAYGAAADHYEYEGGAFRIVRWAAWGRLRRM
jgi:hypothetical protein